MVVGLSSKVFGVGKVKCLGADSCRKMSGLGLGFNNK